MDIAKMSILLDRILESQSIRQEKEILQQRLLQTSKLASIGELAAGVAHEINNPLAFVTSNCNALVGYLDSMQKYIGLVEADVKQMVTDDNVIATFNERKKTMDIDYLLEDAKPMMEETLDGLARVSKIVKYLNEICKSADFDKWMQEIAT